MTRVRRSNSGKSYRGSIYISHNPCCLTNAPPYVVGTLEIRNCAAFLGGQNCPQCGHRSGEYEQTRVKRSERLETTTDLNFAAALKINDNEVVAKEAQIQALQKRIQELGSENRQIQ
ncbi:hypothetical protein CC78DRAFT_583617 [Lojkania enalia]|uniref:DUF8206 domain-containing protein n=1 Tax=Lojkania enalia TaxID=147567 RepID=A0A9P4K3M3_9PLEO|nr:hypothetical protein CC78DRAFT_583617 [Didymosphaeria enalia]